ncbi:YibE/F family protein [bacterium]|nr:YibE/F family protein [bacterium]
MKKILLFLTCIILFCTNCFAIETDTVLKSETGLIKHIEYTDDYDSGNNKQIVDVEIKSGKFKGETVQIENVLTGNPYYDIILKRKDNVILHLEQADDGIQFFISDIKRVQGLYFLLGIFILLVVAVGRKKGLMSLIATGLIVCLVIWFLTPMILSGINPIFSTVLLCLVSSAIAVYFVGGLNVKSTSAVFGTVLSLILSAILSVIVIKISRLTGFCCEESVFLYSAHPELNFVGILTSAMLISTLGAVIDIAMSIASTINEVFELNMELTFKELFHSGMNVGKDIIGTMTNTLILVYLGGSLPLVLLAHNIDLTKFFNLNMVVTEIASALVGSIALVICVPMTAVITSYLLKLKNNRTNTEFEFDNRK